MEIAEIAKELERSVNCMGNSAEMNELAMHMTAMHRTLVQSFTGSFVLNFVHRLALYHRSGNFDGRNEAACRLCDLMWSALEADNPYLAELKEKDGFSLPLI